MYVSVELHLSPNVPLASVPEHAVRPGKAVWVVRDGRLKVVRPVRLVELVNVADETGLEQSHWVIELAGSGMRPGDQVVASPLNYATDGMEVRVQQP
jgi:hypothetical protein